MADVDETKDLKVKIAILEQDVASLRKRVEELHLQTGDSAAFIARLQKASAEALKKWHE